MEEETMNSAVRAFLIIVWAIVSFAIAFIFTLMMEIVTDSPFGVITGWSMVFIIFLIFQVFMYKSGLLSSKRSKPPTPKETPPAGTGPSSSPGISRSREQGEFSGVVQDLKRERDSTFFSLMVSGAVKPTFYRVEANVEGLALNEGDTVWLKGKPGKDGTLRTAAIKHLSVSRQTSVTAMSGRETSPQGADMTGPAISEAGKRNCPMCGGTGTQKIMQWKTVMEPQTVYEQVTEFRFGKPVSVTMPRTVQRAVQKPDYKMVPCSTCKGTGKV
jgi:hypothetical protein